MKNTKKLVGAVAALAVASALATGTTYAWFTAGNKATVSSFDAQVTGSADGALQVAAVPIGASFDSTNTREKSFKSTLSKGDIYAAVMGTNLQEDSYTVVDKTGEATEMSNVRLDALTAATSRSRDTSADKSVYMTSDGSTTTDENAAVTWSSSSNTSDKKVYATTDTAAPLYTTSMSYTDTSSSSTTATYASTVKDATSTWSNYYHDVSDGTNTHAALAKQAKSNYPGIYSNNEYIGTNSVVSQAGTVSGSFAENKTSIPVYKHVGYTAASGSTAASWGSNTNYSSTDIPVDNTYVMVDGNGNVVNDKSKAYAYVQLILSTTAEFRTRGTYSYTYTAATSGFSLYNTSSYTGTSSTNETTTTVLAANSKGFTADKSSNNSYVAFDLIFRTKTASQNIVLTTGSEVTATGSAPGNGVYGWSTTTQYIAQKTDNDATTTTSGITSTDLINARAAYASRVAFVKSNTDVVSKSTADGNTPASMTAASKVWSPNEGLIGGGGVTVNTTSTTLTGNQKGYWVNNLASDYNDRQDNEIGVVTSAVSYGDSTTSGANSESDSNTVIKPTTQDLSNYSSTNNYESYVGSFGTTDNDGYYYFRMTVYVWIEGTDGDCFDSIFTDTMSVTMKFQALATATTSNTTGA